jgi:hypothetical protein
MLRIEVVRKEWPADNYPFSLANAPIRAENQRPPDSVVGIDKNGLVDVLPAYPAKASGPLKR